MHATGFGKLRCSQLEGAILVHLLETQGVLKPHKRGQHVEGRRPEFSVSISRAPLRRCSATRLHRRSIEASGSTMSTASANGEGRCHHLCTPVTQRWDTVYWKRGMTY